MQAINIVAVVDVIGALSQRSLENCMFMADNGCQSVGQGTAELKTVCRPGQCVAWKVYPVDVQTPVLIKAITFLDGEAEARAAAGQTRYGPGTAGSEPEWTAWNGTVPCDIKPGLYRYRLELQMCKGANSVMSAETAAIEIVAP